MKREKGESSFTLLVPEVENIYELVVVASLRARQLNRYPHLRDMDQPVPMVEQALSEAFRGELDAATRIEETPAEGEEESSEE